MPLEAWNYAWRVEGNERWSKFLHTRSEIPSIQTFSILEYLKSNNTMTIPKFNVCFFNAHVKSFVREQWIKPVHQSTVSWIQRWADEHGKQRKGIKKSWRRAKWTVRKPLNGIKNWFYLLLELFINYFSEKCLASKVVSLPIIFFQVFQMAVFQYQFLLHLFTMLVKCQHFLIWQMMSQLPDSWSTRLESLLPTKWLQKCSSLHIITMIINVKQTGYQTFYKAPITFSLLHVSLVIYTRLINSHLNRYLYLQQYTV